MTQNGIIWFRLCGFSGLIYNTISFHRQKVQILQKSPIFPPAASNRYGLTDCYAKNRPL